MISDQPKQPQSSPDKARIVFAGSPEFALPSLRGLVAAGYTVVGVLTQPDRPAGRGRKLRSSPVKIGAGELGLPIFQPDTLSQPVIQKQLADLHPDLLIVVAYGLLLPAAVLEIAPAGCINVHASLLPRWRGASPIQAAILAGDQSTGVSIMQMDAGLDTGPVHATQTAEIGAHETAGDLEARLAEEGAGLLIESLPGILDHSMVAVPQSDAEATYAARIDKTDALIDWGLSAVEIDRRIRAYNPWPVAYTMLDGARMRCWSAASLGASPDTIPPAQPGTVVAVGDAGIDVQTGEGTLQIRELQMPGKQRMTAIDFANGYAVLSKCLGAPR